MQFWLELYVVLELNVSGLASAQFAFSDVDMGLGMRKRPTSGVWGSGVSYSWAFTLDSQSACFEETFPA